MNKPNSVRNEHWKLLLEILRAKNPFKRRLCQIKTICMVMEVLLRKDPRNLENNNVPQECGKFSNR